MQFRFIQSTVLALALLAGPTSSSAAESMSFDEIVSLFKSTRALDMELFMKGKHSNIRHLFKNSISSLSETDLRNAGMKAYASAQKDREFYQLAALLLFVADGKAVIPWLQPPSGTPAKQRMAAKIKAEKSIETTRRWKGYAAFQAANDLSHLTDDNSVLGPSHSYHYIASTAGIQRSYMSLGYLTREYRLDNPNYSDMRGLIATEKTYFLSATYCYDEHMKDKWFPYEKSLCKIATKEMIASEKASRELIRPGIHPDTAQFFGLLGLVGLAIIENAKNNPSAGSASGIQPIQGPSHLETHLWLNPGG